MVLLVPGNYHEVCAVEVGDLINKSQLDAGLVLQREKIIVVGDEGKLHYREI